MTGGVIVQYGPAVAGLLALAALGLLAAAVAAGLRRGALTVRGLIGGVLAFPLVTLLTTAVAVLAWFGLKAAVPDLGVLTLGTDQNAFFVFGLVAFALAVFAALYAPLLRRARTENLALGALAWWVVLSVGFALAAPSAAYLWTLPALAAVGVALWRISGERSAAWRWAAGVGAPVAVLIVVYAPVMLIFTVLAFRLDGMGLPAVGLMGLFTALAAGLLVPHLEPRLAGTARAARAAAGSRRSPPRRSRWCLSRLAWRGSAMTRAYPRPDFVSYVLDADTGRAAWEAGDRESWTAPLLRNAREAEVELAPFSTFSGWRAPAPAVDRPGTRARARRRATGWGQGVAAAAAAVGSRRRQPRDRVPRIGPDPRRERRGARAPAHRGDARRGPEAPVRRAPGRRHRGGARAPRRRCAAARMSDWTQGLPARLDVPDRPADTMPAPLSFRADPTVVVK